MQSTLRPAARVFALILASACLVAGCKKAPEVDATSAASPTDSDAPPAPATQDTPTDSGPADEAAFDIGTLPVSDAALGAFPYLGIPPGYKVDGEERSDFDRVPFWTGDRVEWIEGKVYSTRVLADTGKKFSPIEFQRNVEAMVKQAGGQEIANGKIPRELTKEIGDDPSSTEYVDGLGDIYNYPTQTFVIHRADRDIWVHLCGYTHSAGLLVAETKPFVATAALLPAEALQSALDKQGKVDVQVNFATDKADMLPDSQPQIDQVAALMKQDTALRLAVNGHTDSSGDAAHNKALSEARAASVVAALVAQGIAAARLQPAGFGQERPIADNTSEEGKTKNRRVELVKLTGSP